MNPEELNELIAERNKKNTVLKQLFDAADENDLEKVKSICEENSSIVKSIINTAELINGKYRHLLECAADDQIAKYLIEQGADLSIAVTNAVQRKDLKAVKSICEKNKSIIQGALKRKSDPLWYATMDHNLNNEIVRYLIEQGANPDQVDRSNCLLLYLQIAKCNFKGARALIDNGANVNIKNQEEDGWVFTGNDAGALKGDMSLHFAIRAYDKNKILKHEKAKEALEFIKLLIEKGAGINAQNELGRTPLRLAKFLEIPEVVALLENAVTQQRKDVANNNSQPEVQQQPTDNTKHNDSKPLNLSSRELAVIGIAMVACALALYFLAPLILGANVGLGAKLALGATGAVVGGYLTSIAVNKCCSERISAAEPN